MEKVIEVKNLVVSFRTVNGFVRAVRDVSFDLYRGETLAIVGESGSGKSVTNRTIMGILPGNGIIDNGEIIYRNQDLTKLTEDEFQQIRGDKIGMIFQDPLSSLNPIMRIGHQITEGMIVNGKRMKNKIKDLHHNEYQLYLNNKIAIKDAKLKLKKDLKENKDDKEKCLKLKEDNKALIEELKSKRPGLKIAYLNAKAEANKTVKEEMARNKEEYQNDAKTIKEKIKQTEDKEEIIKLKKELKDRKETYKRTIKVTRKEAYERALEIMAEVGIDHPEKRFRQYPFQFSGGMRQRIVIAIALTANPEVLICDEPTTALDVTIQAQILQLIKKIKKERNLTVIFITHDLGVVANIADRVAVMYAGKIVEFGTSDEVFYNPKHPYTWALLSSMPDLNSKERLFAIPGTPPDMLFPPVGDAFAERNKYAMKIDYEQEPPFFKVSDTHYAATWLLHPMAPKVEMPAVISERIKTLNEAKEVTPNE